MPVVSSLPTGPAASGGAVRAASGGAVRAAGAAQSPVIETRRLLLRPVAAIDAARLTELDSDPAVMRYVSGGRPTPRSLIEDWVIPRAVAEMSLRPGSGMWTSIDLRSGWFVGCFALRAPRHSARAELELTYRLRQGAWGRGMATEGSAALLRHAFGVGSADRVFAGTVAGNSASRRVMVKLGMSVVEHEDPTAMERAADLEYEIMRSDWIRHTVPDHQHGVVRL